MDRGVSAETAARRARRAIARGADPRPRGKTPLGGDGLPCTWSREFGGWLNSSGSPHKVVRNAARRAAAQAAADPRPRGRAPHDADGLKCMWSEEYGGWLDARSNLPHDAHESARAGAADRAAERAQRKQQREEEQRQRRLRAAERIQQQMVSLHGPQWVTFAPPMNPDARPEPRRSLYPLWQPEPKRVLAAQFGRMWVRAWRLCSEVGLVPADRFERCSCCPSVWGERHRGWARPLCGSCLKCTQRRVEHDEAEWQAANKAALRAARARALEERRERAKARRTRVPGEASA